MYTALSRGTSAEGTIILQGFDSVKLTSGTSGYLRQEFREIEILDHITELRFERQLHPTITGVDRNTLIRRYRQHFGCKYMPNHLHKSLSWDGNSGEWLESSEALPFKAETDAGSSTLYEGAKKRPHPDSGSNVDSRIVEMRGRKRQKTVEEIHDEGRSSGKRKLSEDDDGGLTSDTGLRHKRARLGANGDQGMCQSYQRASSIGIQWDEIDWSCPYDSVLYPLLNYGRITYLFGIATW